VFLVLLAGREVVHDQVEIEIGGDRCLRLAKEVQLLLLPVTRLARRDQLTGG
jgi:glutamine synthetase